MPPTARFAEEQAVSVRHVGAPPPAYDPQTEKVVSAPPVAMKKKVTG
jgi:hypothetical protein